MRLCQNHWQKVLDQSKTPLVVNVLVMQKILDKLGPDVYKMQEELGDGCPICFMHDETLLDEAIKEVNR